MFKRIRDRWIKALRSGNYKQGRGRLCTKDGEYCCLGVLTDLYIKSKAGKENNARWEVNKDTGSPWFASKDGVEAEFLPKEVMKWAGLDTNNPVIDTVKLERNAASLNDETPNYSTMRHRFTFFHIANRIEKHL